MEHYYVVGLIDEAERRAAVEVIHGFKAIKGMFKTIFEFKMMRDDASLCSNEFAHR